MYISGTILGQQMATPIEIFSSGAAISNELTGKERETGLPFHCSPDIKLLFLLCIAAVTQIGHYESEMQEVTCSSQSTRLIMAASEALFIILD